MGNACNSGIPESTKAAIADSQSLDRILNNQMQEENKVVKLLLLGTGESGKSTIFKQMQILYQKGFNDYEKATFRSVIRRNVVEAMQALIMGARKYGYPFTSNGNIAADMMMRLDPLAPEFWIEECIACIQTLWNPHENGIIEMYRNRAAIQLLDSAPYLFENVARIGSRDYTPTQQDILRARLRTSGIVERLIRINGVDFKFLDVGGQRNERRKWIHCFENVTAIIFVAAISEYDQTLYEDEKENRLKESIRVFESICNNKYFKNTAVILFMNKIDLFADKVGVSSIRQCFPEYDGPDQLLEASEYIRDRFLEVNKDNKLIFSHITCATDTANISKVFEACRIVILQENLRKVGLH